MRILKSWLEVSPGSDFSLANLPFGIISTTKDTSPRPAVALGDWALDLRKFAEAGGFSGLASKGHDSSVYKSDSLNAFASLGRPVHRDVRLYLQDVFRQDTQIPAVLKDNSDLQAAALIPLKDVTNHLPLAIGDYTDFFAGRNHAFNVGTLFRGPENALNPNYGHLPVAYHGRASSVVVSGTPITRPHGQVLKNPTAEPKIPTFQPCARLDIELEMAMFICKPNGLGKPISVENAEEHIFGYALMNDWSARDLQVWEYVPLGPFNAKNFGTTISAWIVLADALEPFRTRGLENENQLQEYLREERTENVFDIDLEVDLKSKFLFHERAITKILSLPDSTAPSGSTTRISKSNAKYLMWSWPQMVAHHSIAGCNLRTGDLFGSGTISGSEEGTHGSMLEQNQAGKKEIQLTGGETRKFLLDGDEISITGRAGEEGAFVGFGSCSGQIVA